MDIKIAPSILSADFVRLADEVEEIKAGGADYVHVDVMDGLFVPNISIGIPVVQSLRKATDMFLDVHLMIDRPHRYVGRFATRARTSSASTSRPTSRRIYSRRSTR